MNKVNKILLGNVTHNNNKQRTSLSIFHGIRYYSLLISNMLLLMGKMYHNSKR